MTSPERGLGDVDRRPARRADLRGHAHPRTRSRRCSRSRRAARARGHPHGQLRPEPPVHARRAAADRRPPRRDGRRARAVIGYLHTGFEKNMEQKTWWKAITYRAADRLRLLPEQRARLRARRSRSCSRSRCPPKATWMRMLLARAEPDPLAPRLARHLRARARRDLDVLVLLPRARPDPRPLRARRPGTRMHTRYFQVGGLAEDIPRGFYDECRKFCELDAEGGRRVRGAPRPQPDLARADEGVGLLSAEDAIALGPVRARSCAPRASTGTCASAQPYLAYDEVDFDVPVYPDGDVYDRYRVRMDEMRESVRIVEQCLDRLEEMQRRAVDRGRPQGRAAAARGAPHLDGVADPPLQDRHRGLPRPRGRGLRRRSSRRAASSAATSSPTAARGRGASSSARPRSSRCRRRRPAAATRLVADMIAIVGSLDTVMGEVDR